METSKREGEVENLKYCHGLKTPNLKERDNLKIVLRLKKAPDNLMNSNTIDVPEALSIENIAIFDV